MEISFIGFINIGLGIAFFLLWTRWFADDIKDAIERKKFKKRLEEKINTITRKDIKSFMKGEGVMVAPPVNFYNLVDKARGRNPNLSIIEAINQYLEFHDFSMRMKPNCNYSIEFANGHIKSMNIIDYPTPITIKPKNSGEFDTSASQSMLSKLHRDSYKSLPPRPLLDEQEYLEYKKALNDLGKMPPIMKPDAVGL